MIVKMTGSDSKIVFKPLPPDDPTQRQPDMSLAKKVLEREIDIYNGLHKTIAHFIEVLT